MEFWGPKTFCLVTGASRGIGKCIAVEFAKKIGPHSAMLLIARSEGALETTKNEILTNNASAAGGAQPLHVLTSALDLGRPEAAVHQNLIQSALTQSGTSASDYDRVLLVHNAGSLGDITVRVTQLDNVADLHDYYAFNVFSMIILTSQFFKIFNDRNKLRSIVQISSKGAVEPFKTWGLYCSGKAARDMLMRSIAEEEEGTIATFNYAPGPVDTDIYTQAATQTGDEQLKNEFAESKAKGQILTCEQTVSKLVRLLAEKKYTKGEHVDYYDIE